MCNFPFCVCYNKKFILEVLIPLNNRLIFLLAVKVCQSHVTIHKQINDGTVIVLGKWLSQSGRNKIKSWCHSVDLFIKCDLPKCR